MNITAEAAVSLWSTGDLLKQWCLQGTWLQHTAEGCAFAKESTTVAM